MSLSDVRILHRSLYKLFECAWLWCALGIIISHWHLQLLMYLMGMLVFDVKDIWLICLFSSLYVWLICLLSYLYVWLICLLSYLYVWLICLLSYLYVWLICLLSYLYVGFIYLFNYLYVWLIWWLIISVNWHAPLYYCRSILFYTPPECFIQLTSRIPVTCTY